LENAGTNDYVPASWETRLPRWEMIGEFKRRIWILKF